MNPNLLLLSLSLSLFFPPLAEKRWGITWKSEVTKLSWSCTQKLHRNPTAMRKGELNMNSSSVYQSPSTLCWSWPLHRWITQPFFTSVSDLCGPSPIWNERSSHWLLMGLKGIVQCFVEIHTYICFLAKGWSSRVVDWLCCRLQLVNLA